MTATLAALEHWSGGLWPYLVVILFGFLTVADLLPDGFRIWIIPHTLEVTNLSRRKAGDRVNLESDLLAKYAEKLLGKV